MDSRPAIEIYTTRTCGYCYAAKRTLESESLDFTEYDVTSDPDKRAWLLINTGQRTVPQVFVDGVCIGGYTELRAALRGGRLQGD
jgi:glutaredoxin 3